MIRNLVQCLVFGACLAVALLIPARAHADHMLTLMAFGGGFDGGTLPHCVEYLGTNQPILYTCDNNFTQGGVGVWLFDASGGIHPETDTGLCLDVWGGVFKCNGSHSQQWYFANGLLRPMWFREFQGCLNVPAGPSPSLDGTVLNVAPCNGSANQIFMAFGVNVILENASTNTCLFYNINSFLQVGTEPCNNLDLHQYFNFVDNENFEGLGAYNLFLETSSGTNKCVSYDGTSGHAAYLDPNDCNAANYVNPLWELWEYTPTQTLRNAQRAGRFNHVCLTQGNLASGNSVYSVTESNCLISAPAQKWIMWINGFPNEPFPIIILPPVL
jgi:hypothetical protein